MTTEGERLAHEIAALRAEVNSLRGGVTLNERRYLAELIRRDQAAAAAQLRVGTLAGFPTRQQAPDTPAALATPLLARLAEQDSNTVAGIDNTVSPALRSHWQRGLDNGAFAQPPALNDNNEITNDNQLPGWQVIDVLGNGHLHPVWRDAANLAGPGTGGYVQLVTTSGGASDAVSGDILRLEQDVLARATLLREDGLPVTISANVGTTGALPPAVYAIVGSQYQDDMTLIRSDEITVDAQTFGVVGSYPSATFSLETVLDPGCAVLRVDIEVRFSGGPTARTYNIYEVAVSLPPAIDDLPALADLGGLYAYDTPHLSAGGKQLYVGTDTPSDANEGDIWIKG